MWSANMRRRISRAPPRSRRGCLELTTCPSPPWRWWCRTPGRLALMAVVTLLAPGLAIGALHVNDILSADLLPGSLFLREGPFVDVDVNVNATGEQRVVSEEGGNGSDSRTHVGNWTDAFLTMDFHRKMMNEYLCRSYVAEQILGDMTEPAPPEAFTKERISSTLRVGSAERATEVEDEKLGSQTVSDDNEGFVSNAQRNMTEPRTELRASGRSTDSPPAPAPGPAPAPPVPPSPLPPPEDTVPRAAGAGRRRQAAGSLGEGIDEPRGNLPTFKKKPYSTPKRRRRRRRKKPNTRRNDPLKDNLLADEGSSAYKDWLARTTLLEDIYRHYDHIAQASDASSAQEQEQTTSFEGGEVTGFALTHPAVSPSLGPSSVISPAVSTGVSSAISPAISHTINPTIISGLGPAISPAIGHVVRPALNFPLHHHLNNHHHPGLSLASSINSFAAPSTPLPLPLPGPAPGGLGYPSAQPAPAESAGVGEDRHPFDYGGGSGEYVESHEHHHSHEHIEKGHHGKMLSLKDLFDLVLTAIAFLAFGAFAIHLIMCLMLIPYQNQNPYYPVLEVPVTAGGGTTGDGAGEAEGGRRRRRRSAATLPSGNALPVAPGVSIDVLNRAAQRVLASIDAAMLAYQPARTARATDGGALGEDEGEDNRDCLHRALCKHNRFSRTVEGSFSVWMPIWSVGLSWVAGRADSGSSSLDNLRAAVLGLGNAKCHIVYPRCSLANRSSRPHLRSEATAEPTPAPAPAPEPPSPTQLGPVAPRPPGIIHSDLIKMSTKSSSIRSAPQRYFTPIGVKSSSQRRRRPRPPHAQAQRQRAP